MAQRNIARPALKATAIGVAFAGCFAFASPAMAASFHVIHDFTGRKEGGVPGCTLLNDANGAFIGTAVLGGANGDSVLL